MADANSTRVHVCHHCESEFTGRKRKYCSEGCAQAHKYNRDMIVKHLGREHGDLTKDRREALYQQFVAEHGSWQGYMDTRPGKEYYHSPEYKRIQRFRQARREGRVQHHKPPAEVRPIWRGHMARVKAWGRYLRVCDRVDSRANAMTPAEKWRWRYRHDPEFRAREKARLFIAKQKRRYQQDVMDDGTVTAEHIDQRTHCIYCGTKLTQENRTIDHMNPLSRGGMHSASNVVECCKPCNSRKHAKPFDVWLDGLEEPHQSNALRAYVKRQGAPPQQMSLMAVS